MTTTQVRPFLMFQGEAEAALTSYVALIPGSEILELTRHGPGEPGPEGKVKRAVVCIGGANVLAIDSPAVHAFTFTPSFSFFVDCASEIELDRIWTALEPGGSVLMPLAAYGFSRRFGWLNDRFGVSWQLNLA
jgi:predicted 3-demethylubiquinone-9 3-methyltransferase (glyoxalase superfamily)